MKILIVEDDLISKTILEYLLKKIFNNIIIDTAENGKDGLQKVNSTTYDLILTDNMMPEMNGIDMIKEILLLSYVPKIVIISSYNEYIDLHNGVHCLGKPVEFCKLVKILKELGLL